MELERRVVGGCSIELHTRVKNETVILELSPSLSYKY